jgi:hypothetical protein
MNEMAALEPRDRAACQRSKAGADDGEHVREDFGRSGSPGCVFSSGLGKVSRNATRNFTAEALAEFRWNLPTHKAQCRRVLPSADQSSVSFQARRSRRRTKRFAFVLGEP